MAGVESGKEEGKWARAARAREKGKERLQGDQKGILFFKPPPNLIS